MNSPNSYRDMPAIADRHLWLGAGIAAIEARCTIYQTGPTSFDVYTGFGGQVPSRFQGTLGDCIDYGQRFCDARKQEGYTEDMQASYPAIPGDTLATG